MKKPVSLILLPLVVAVLVLATVFVPWKGVKANEGSPMTKVTVHIDPTLQSKGWRYLQVYSPRCAADPKGCLPSELARIPFENGVASYHMNYDYVATFYLQKEWRAEFRLAAVVASLDSFKGEVGQADVWVFEDGRPQSFHYGEILAFSGIHAIMLLEQLNLPVPGVQSQEDRFKANVRIFAKDLWPDW